MQELQPWWATPAPDSFYRSAGRALPKTADIGQYILTDLGFFRIPAAVMRELKMVRWTSYGRPDRRTLIGKRFEQYEQAAIWEATGAARTGRPFRLPRKLP